MASPSSPSFPSASSSIPTPAPHSLFLALGPLPFAPVYELLPDSVPYVTYDIGLDTLTDII